MNRLLIVSNRLPVTVAPAKEGMEGERSPEIFPSSGGLASALRGPHEKRNSQWIGWPGDLSRSSSSEREQITAALSPLRMSPVFLSAAEVSKFYDGFSNGVLWPLFHYLLEKVRLDAQADFNIYRVVNVRFADEIIASYREGDTIWVHDYHLSLVPELVRRRIPDARIGFFLHTPFPSADVFGMLPWRQDILRGMLGADLVGFHTQEYADHFVGTVAHHVDALPSSGGVTYEGRQVSVGAYPISIDVARFEERAQAPEVIAEAAAIRERAGGRTIVLGVDRLDYTKGILRRLLTIERMLERDPELHDKAHFIQLAVPSRERVDAYAKFKSQVNEVAGRINGKYGDGTRVPLHLLHRSIDLDALLALYRAADVMLVTPLRDGMNLVAKEYVASRVDETGVLILSEFAGAAAELQAALLVNPHDLEAVAHSLSIAIAMPKRERVARMRRLRAHVRANDVFLWLDTFLTDLDAVARAPRQAPIPGEQTVVERLSQSVDGAARILLLDYDGTLVPYAPLPELATPDDKLLELLGRLAASSNVSVHVISGRPREVLEEWLGALPIALHAEHGYWSREVGATEWRARHPEVIDWMREVRAVLASHARRVRGSFVEEKTASIAWHYRLAEAHVAAAHIGGISAEIERLPIADKVDLIQGMKVFEIKAKNANKGLIARDILAHAPANASVLAAGDDTTDESLFASLPPSAISVRVGRGPTIAGFRVADHQAVRRILTQVPS